MQQKLATTAVNIHELMQTRWSPRAFDPNRAIADDDLMALLEAARWTPSCFNDQPWRFIVCNKTTDPVSWQQALATLVEKNQLWAKNAPVLILAVAMTNFSHNGKPNQLAMYDTGAATMSLCLQAVALGLVSHQMGGFDAAKARDVFKLPAECQPMAMIALGYQGDIELLDPDFKAAELAERSRAELKQRFYFGQWDAE